MCAARTPRERSLLPSRTQRLNRSAPGVLTANVLEQAPMRVGTIMPLGADWQRGQDGGIQVIDRFR